MGSLQRKGLGHVGPGDCGTALMDCPNLSPATQACAIMSSLQSEQAWTHVTTGCWLRPMSLGEPAGLCTEGSLIGQSTLCVDSRGVRIKHESEPKMYYACKFTMRVFYYYCVHYSVHFPLVLGTKWSIQNSSK